MKVIIVIGFFIQFTIVGCGGTNKLNENRILIKEYAYCKCLQYAFNDSLFKDDISLSVYKEIAHYDFKAFENIDTLSRQFALRIKPSEIADYANKKAILSDCFLFYKSKHLDSVIRTLDKLSFKSW